MTYRLWYTRRFRRQLDALPGDVRAAAKKAITQLTQQPYPRDAKELENHPGFWRMWLPRDHRLIWRVLDEEQIVNLLFVGPKTPDLYEQLGLSKRLREWEDELEYEIEPNQTEIISAETEQESTVASVVK